MDVSLKIRIQGVTALCLSQAMVQAHVGYTGAQDTESQQKSSGVSQCQFWDVTHPKGRHHSCGLFGTLPPLLRG